jgi:hypothetical protein
VLMWLMRLMMRLVQAMGWLVNATDAMMMGIQLLWLWRRKKRRMKMIVAVEARMCDVARRMRRQMLMLMMMGAVAV